MNLKKYDIVTNAYVLQCLQISLIFFLSGCFWSDQKQSSKLVLINVLDEDYFKDCHIPGSINIPFDTFEAKIKKLNKLDQYVIYCSNFQCTAAPFAAQLLEKAGFANVSILPGGIVQWYQAGYPCIGIAQKEYLTDINEQLDDEDHMGVKIISAASLKSLIDQQSTSK